MDASLASDTQSPIVEIDGLWLRDALVTGIHKVISHRDHLNHINVFPVADGDTGTNLALTLHAILIESTRKAVAHAGEFLERVADDAIDGARGNSGAILAQYWQGFFEAVGETPLLRAAELAAAAVNGARSARIAIAEPREGTMLSVIRDHAAELAERSGAGMKDIRELLRAGLDTARQSLARTPSQLPVLAEAGVVDAGAQGFVDLLAGIQEYADTGSVTNVLPVGLQLPDEAPMTVALNAGEEPAHRYCTECVITGDAIDRRKLHDELINMGCSSLVLAGTRNKLRVHIHTDHPDEVFERCARFGAVSSQKADDMDRQTDSLSAGGKAVVVADSGADIPESLLESLRIHLVPLRVNVKDAQYIDKVSLSGAQFYRLLDESSDYPTTSQPPPSDFRRQFEFLSSHFESVLCVSVSKALSGTWQAAQSAAQRFDAKRITVWDSRSVSSGQGLLAIFAAEAVAAGIATDRIVAMLELMRSRTRAYAAISDLSYAVRGGRIRPPVGRIADLLHLTPVLATRDEGIVAPAGVFLGRRDVPRRLARWIVRRLKPAVPYRVLIADCDAPQAAAQVSEQLRASDRQFESIHLAQAGAALGAHAGPGNVVVGIQEYLSPAEAEALVKAAKD